ncbi:MAG: class I SAM-dependent methyltransferase [Erysipelotrichaceae bacterium]|nr:class I SAM-dependent methyltransferase [Erysipelotrichaceae bacterium]
MNHYFTSDPSRKPNRKSIDFRFLGISETFISDDGVFSKDTLDFGSRVLLETVIGRDLRGDLLDLGCGLGYMGVLLKKHHPELNVTMIDINETAVELAEENSRLYHQENRCICNDGLNGITDRFDAIVFNPPIRTGKDNVYRMLDQALEHLNEGGCLYIVMRRQQGAESAVRHLQEHAKPEVLEKKKGYWVVAICN